MDLDSAFERQFLDMASFRTTWIGASCIEV